MQDQPKLTNPQIERVTDEIAAILWRSGPQSSDWEDGAPPSWEEIIAGRARKFGDDATEAGRELNDAYTGYWLDTWHKAEALQALDAREAIALAQILMAIVAQRHEQMEIDLWHKVERAAGYEPGSLTNVPGVRQRIFL